MEPIEKNESSKTQTSPLGDFIYKYSGAELFNQIRDDLTRDRGKPADNGRSSDDKLGLPVPNDANTGKLPSIQKDLTDEKAKEQLPKEPEDIYYP